MGGRTKGQISIDYYVALIVFIFFVVYFLFQVSNLVPNFIGHMEEQRMRSEAYQISELLVNDIGKPANWDTLPLAQVSRIGLSDQSRNKTNLVSTLKVTALDAMCDTPAEHQSIRGLIVTDLQFSINVTDRTNDNVLVDNCKPATPNLRGFGVTVIRNFAFNDGRYGELKLEVWRP